MYWIFDFDESIFIVCIIVEFDFVYESIFDVVKFSKLTLIDCKPLKLHVYGHVNDVWGP